MRLARSASKERSGGKGARPSPSPLGMPILQDFGLLVEMPKANKEIDTAIDHWAEGIAASLMQELIGLAGLPEVPPADNP